MYSICYFWYALILFTPSYVSEIWHQLCYKTRSCLDLKKQKERKEEKKKKTEVNTTSSQLKMKS